MISECREAGLLHSSREQEIRNRAYEIYLQRGGNLAMSWKTGCGPNANSQRISLVIWYWLYRPPRQTGYWKARRREHAFRPPSLDSERFARRGTEGHWPEAANTPL
jgi:hypothetical protein